MLKKALRHLTLMRWSLLIVAISLSACVTSTDRTTIQTDINEIKQDSYHMQRSIKALSKQLKQVEANMPKEQTLTALRNSQTSFYSQISDLLREIQELRGSFDEGMYKIKKRLKHNEAELKMLKAPQPGLASDGGPGLKEIAARLDNIEAELVLLKGKVSVLDRTIADRKPVPAPKVKKTPKTKYDEAYALYKEKKYPEARRKWQEFLKKFPKHKLAGNSYYWIAETLYAEQDYDDAILSYEEVLANFKSSPKVPYAMLKQAYAFGKLGDNKAARSILKSLIQKHPAAEVIPQAKKKLKDME